MPKAITHERRLRDAGEFLDRFLSEIGGLGPKLGPLLVQLPPSLAYVNSISNGFFVELRGRVEGDIVVEPRHASWFPQRPTSFSLACGSRGSRPTAGRPKS